MSKTGGVIVAGGKGSRMGSSLPKQYIKVGGKPLLIHTLESLHRYDVSAEWIVVVPQGDIPYVQGLLEIHFPSGKMRVTAGGQTRTESVRNGLGQLSPQVERVAIHDGVRPMITHELMDRLLQTEAPVVIPVVPCVDSLRMREGGENRAVDRSNYCSVQTPQVFERKVIEEAYRLLSQMDPAPSYTDDASLVEGLLGIAPVLVQGEPDNIKVTSPKDLAIARWLLGERQSDKEHDQ